MNKVMISLLISFPNKSMENHLTVFSMNCKIVFDCKNIKKKKKFHVKLYLIIKIKLYFLFFL